MALFQPTNVTPSTFNGTGTVDISRDMTVSWQVNGNSAMRAYQIMIMQNDTESTEVLDTGKVTLDTPFSGVNYAGQIQPFSVIIPAADMATAGMENGYANGYKIAITQWWGSTDAESIAQTSASYFITRTAPTLTMQSTPGNVSFTEYLFYAYYAQAEGDGMEWMEWELQASSSGDTGTWEAIDDTGPIYGVNEFAGTTVQLAQYRYDGFVPGTYYRVQCTVQTINGVTVDTGWTNWRSPVIAPSSAPLILCPLCEQNGVKVQMPKNFPLKGNASGSYTLNSGNVAIASGGAISWGGVSANETLDIPVGNDYICIFGTIGAFGGTNTIARFGLNETDEMLLTCNASGVYLGRSGESPAWQYTGITPSNGDLFAFAMKDGTAYFLLTENGAQSYFEGTIDADIFAWQTATVDSLTLYGPNTYEFVWACESSMITDVQSLLIGRYKSPYSMGTDFMLQFLNVLYTGNISDANISRIAIYRRQGDGIAIHIADCPLESNFSMIDYGARSQTSYTYFYSLISEDSAVSYIRGLGESAAITPVFWDYALLCCSQTANGRFVVEKEYRFALDVATGNVGNNNTPGLQANFTPYPTRQPTASNYRSGTLTAFIGKVANDQYTDSVDLMKELYALSTSPLAKFLKTRKGDMLRVETSAPVSMQIGDKYAAQPAKIGLPWVETDDATSAVLFDGENLFNLGYPIFSLDPATMELTVQYDTDSGLTSTSFGLENGDLVINDAGNLDASQFYMTSDKTVYYENGI